MDNYVDCTQYPSIYETLPAIYDLWRHQWELLNDTKQPESALLLTPVSDRLQKFTKMLLFALIMHQFWTRKECKGSLFLQAGNICNSLKNFSRYFSNFSWKMMFISLVVFTVPLQQTMKWKGMAKNANNERGWQKIQTIKKDGEKWKGLRPMQIIWDKRGSQVKMVGLTVLSLAECKFCKTAPKNENWPWGAWTLATSCILQVKPIYIRPQFFDLITVWPCWPLEWHRRDCITSGCLKNFF